MFSYPVLALQFAVFLHCCRLLPKVVDLLGNLLVLVTCAVRVSVVGSP